LCSPVLLQSTTLRAVMECSAFEVIHIVGV
jgi:hypothetical protein